MIQPSRPGRNFRWPIWGFCFFGGIACGVLGGKIFNQGETLEKEVSAEAHPVGMESVWEEEDPNEATVFKTASFTPEVTGGEAVFRGQEGIRAGPIPLEWEECLFGALDNTDIRQRNSALIQLATVTARKVPRVQAECLAHLTYSLSEADYAQFLSLAKNPSIPVESRVTFVEETFKIRRPEFSEWLAKNLLSQSQDDVSTLALKYLTENNH